MNWNFWKGVLVGVGGLLVFGMILNLWGWLPWLLLGAGGVYGYYRLTRKPAGSLDSPASKARQLMDEVDRRIDEFRR